MKAALKRICFTWLFWLKVNGANWLLVLEKNWSWENSFHYCHVGPLLAMPSGQGLNMTLLAILKVNGANWLLVLEKNWSCGKKTTIDKISLLSRQHYYYYDDDDHHHRDDDDHHHHHHQSYSYATLHYNALIKLQYITATNTTTITLHHTTLRYINYITFHYNCKYHYTALQTLHYNYNYNTLDYTTLYLATVHNTTVHYNTLH